MPFGNPKTDSERARLLENTYSQWIKPCVESIEIPNTGGRKLECHRADKDPRPGDIISHIVENLVDSELVIADLSGRNPNVFYELGVRHAVGVATILIADNLDDIPFDLRTQRTIPYKYDPEGMIKFRDDLQKALQAILKSPPEIDNPVRRFLYQRELEKLRATATPPGYDALKEVLAEVTSLRGELSRHSLEMRDIIRAVSSTSPQLPVSGPDAIDLRAFEGLWRAKPSGSLACAKLVRGELLIPYCYSGDGELTGHYYNCRAIGKTLFGRFEWFYGGISGVSFYRVISENCLEGGWWFDEDVPVVVREDVSQVADSLPGMRGSTWTRVRDIKTPAWAEKYFKEGPPKRRD